MHIVSKQQHLADDTCSDVIMSEEKEKMMEEGGLKDRGITRDLSNNDLEDIGEYKKTSPHSIKNTYKTIKMILKIVLNSQLSEKCSNLFESE